ncbi:MAG: hypothetical protein OXB93_01645 [Cytophagales bacterium]|nr:hypothetical protein [Cytophagales bacterium]
MNYRWLWRLSFRYGFGLGTLGIVFSLHGQRFSGTEIPLGSWRSHFHYQQSFQLAQYGRVIFSHARHSLVSYDLEKRLWQRHAQTRDLSGIHITALGSDQGEEQVLAVGYQDGGIDFLRKDKWTTLNYLRTSPLAIPKAIRDFFFTKEYIYVAGDYGLFRIQREKLEPEQNYFELGHKGTQTLIHQVLIRDAKLFLLTDEEVLVGAEDEPLEDYRFWKRYSFENLDICYLAVQGGRVHVFLESLAGNTKIFFYQDGEWQEKEEFPFRLDFHRREGSTWYFGNQENYFLQKLGEEKKEFTWNSSANLGHVVDILPFEGKLWIADSLKGIGYVAEDNRVEYVVFNHPVPASHYRLNYVQEKLWAIPITDPPSKSLSFFEENTWHTLPITDEIPQTLKPWVPNGEGNYLLANEEDVEKPLDPMPSFLLSSVRGRIKQMKTTAWGDIWTILRRAEDEKDVLLIFHLQNRNFLVIERVEDFLQSPIYDMDLDSEQAMWIASHGGLFVIQNTFTLLSDGMARAYKPSLGNAFLFQAQPVYAIEIDGGNNKWIANTQGIAYLNTQQEKLEVLTYPKGIKLPPNIYDMEWQADTGELFISLSQGIVSYRTFSSRPQESPHQLRIFPNPVPFQYMGRVSMSGLSASSIVKLIRPGGQLVKEVESNGGTASFRSQDLPSGVYILLSSDMLGRETYVGKITILR